MRSRFRAFIDYMRFVYGSEWPYAVGLFSSLLAIIISTLEQEISRDIVLAAGSAGALITSVLLLYDSLNLYHRWAGAVLRFGGIRDSEAYFSGTQWHNSVDNEDTNDGFVDLVGSGDGVTVERIWRDAAVDRVLWDNVTKNPDPKADAHQAQLELRRTRYILPDSLKDIAPRALRATSGGSDGEFRNRRPIWFNGKLARLMTEPTAHGLASSTLGMQAVSFYDGQSSNELWSWTQVRIGLAETNLFKSLARFVTDRFRKLRHRRAARRSVPELANGSRSVAHDYAVDSTGKILSLSDARMANIVGISLLAITADGQVLFVRQTERNSVLPKGFAASSSGSLDWADAKKVQSRAHARRGTVLLRDVLFEGMLRELFEESQVHRSEVIDDSRYVTGYFRWLRRGAKPEFTGIVRLTVTLAELNGRRVKGTEKNYTAGRFAVPVSLLQQAAGGWTQNQPELYEALHAQLPEYQRPTVGHRIPIGVSSMATWCAAADFLDAHPSYLSDLQLFKPPHDRS